MRKRLIFVTLMSVGIILLGLGIVSSYNVNQSIEHSLSERSEHAALIANYTDYQLRDNLTRLYDISLSGAVDFTDNDWEPEQRALQTAYQYSMFTDGIFLLDLQGNVVATYPPYQIEHRNMKSIPFIQKTLNEKRSVISPIYTQEDTGRKVIYMLVPLKDSGGQIIGVAGGEIDPTNYILNNIIRAVPVSDKTMIELVDSNGFVIASNNPSRIFTCSDRNKVLGTLIAEKKPDVMKCHRCHDEMGSKGDIELKKTTDMLVFYPLTEAPWGISIREPESVVFAPSTAMRTGFIVLGLIATGSALLLSMGFSMSIIRPISSLIDATKRIADGDLNEPVNVESEDEIGLLSGSLDVMRRRLLESRQQIESYNLDLERRVAKRTEELQKNRQRLAKLFHDVIRAQEDERKRIARELHDETSQSIAAIGMSLEIAELALKENKLTQAGLSELKGKVTQVLDGIGRMIRALRPPVLDDLGLESGVRSFLESHFSGRDMKYSVKISDNLGACFTGLTPKIRKNIELTLFRVIQEAMFNITKHSGATNVSVVLSCNSLRVMVDIIDNGVGFDVEEVLGSKKQSEEGFGLIGMMERVSLMEGKIDINSAEGEGTKIHVEIPTIIYN